MIYRHIVEKELRAGFEALNRGDHQRVMDLFAPEFEHVFYGEHALGGARHQHRSIVPWYARLQTCFPDLRFEVQAVAVRGLPWNTVALVEWRDHFTLRDGTPGGNQGVHVLRLKWGKVVSLRVYCDTQVVAGALNKLEQQGVKDAGAAPITDEYGVPSDTEGVAAPWVRACHRRADPRLPPFETIASQGRITATQTSSLARSRGAAQSTNERTR